MVSPLSVVPANRNRYRRNLELEPHWTRMQEILVSATHCLVSSSNKIKCEVKKKTKITEAKDEAKMLVKQIKQANSAKHNWKNQ